EANPLIKSYRSYLRALVDYRDAYQWRTSTKAVDQSEEIRAMEKHLLEEARLAREDFLDRWRSGKATIVRLATPPPPVQEEEPRLDKGEAVHIRGPPVFRISCHDRALTTFFETASTDNAKLQAAASGFTWQ